MRQKCIAAPDDSQGARGTGRSEFDNHGPFRRMEGEAREEGDA